MLKIKAIYIYNCPFTSKNYKKQVRKCRISGQESILKLSECILHAHYFMYTA